MNNAGKKAAESPLKIFLIFIGFWGGFGILLWLFYPLYNKLENSRFESIYRAKAIVEMQDECEKNCARYQVTQSELKGPSLEVLEPVVCLRNKPCIFSYVFSWRSDIKSVVLKISYEGPKDYSDLRITRQWNVN